MKPLPLVSYGPIAAAAAWLIGALSFAALASQPLAQEAPTATTESPASPAAEPLPRVLFLTHSAGFTHGVVKRVETGKRALAERALATAATDLFVVDATQDCAAITAENLARYAAVVFYTTGELPIAPARQAELLAWIRGGGGFVGIHPATDTWYENADYGEMIGGRFDGHPWHQDVEVVVERPTHPAVAHLGASFRIRDEIYQFKNWSRDRVDVLLRLANDSVAVEKGKRDDDDYALAWSRDYGDGRVFYTALGHRPEVWADERFVRHVLAGIRWAGDARGTWSKAPANATILFDGEDTSNWLHPDGKPCRWKVVDGALEVVRGSGSIVTRDAWNDFRLHVEFATPARAEGSKAGQGRGNSGVYLQCRYEVQILDSFGDGAPKPDGCAALYRQRAADVNACAPPEEWQTYDIVFRAARFDDAGEKTANARITVVHNGVFVHRDVEVKGKTGAGKREGPDALPLKLQDHGNPVRFRNLWIAPL